MQTANGWGISRQGWAPHAGQRPACLAAAGGWHAACNAAIAGGSALAFARLPHALTRARAHLPFLSPPGHAAAAAAAAAAVVDFSPRLQGNAGRAGEIAAFLDESLAPAARGTCPFVIIDDREVVAGAHAHTDLSGLAGLTATAAGPHPGGTGQAVSELARRLGPHFVRTRSEDGLTDAAVEAAVAILLGKN